MKYRYRQSVVGTAILFACGFAPVFTAQLRAEQSVATGHAVVNFAELANRESVARATATPSVTGHKVMPRPRKPMEAVDASVRQPVPSVPVAGASLPISPAPAASFLGLADNDTSIPPDAMGAVGPNHVITMLNTQVRIQHRSGGTISTVTLDGFWSALGTVDAFDPHVVYDPFNDRWIVSSVADAASSTASVLVGVSENDDPTGNWFLYKVDVDATNQRWGDYDTLGFNKNWIVVSVNMFRNSGPGAIVNIYAFNKADLYANGTGSHTLLQDTSGVGFTMVPATTYDNSLNTFYLVEDWLGNQGKLRISTITGTVGAEVLTKGTAFPTSASTWDSGGFDDFAPQLGSTRQIDTGDSRLLSCVYRNGSLWCAQTAFLPANSPTRTAAQWWQFTPSGTIEQFGRVDDPSGAKFYAYPSLAVNASNDVLIGYSRFSDSQYASGNYSYRFHFDPANSLRGEQVAKAGEGVYYKTNGGGVNRWGDYSAASVDPQDDMTLWTVQEYARAPVGSPTTDGSGRWGTWWVRIDADTSPPALSVNITRPATGMTYPALPSITITADPTATTSTITKVEFFAGATKLGETNASPFTIVWSNVASGTYALTATATDNNGAQATSDSVNIDVGNTASPLGTWSATVKGVDKGIVFTTYADDFTLSGYGLTLGVPGLFAISGTWSMDGRGQLSGDYSEDRNGTNHLAGTFTGKGKGGKSISTKVVSNTDTQLLTIKGSPAVAAPDLSGSWTASVTTTGSVLAETYTFSATSTNGVFDVSGTGSVYSVTGTILIGPKNAVNAVLFTDDGVATRTRSLSGKFNATSQSLTLTGADNAANKVSVKAAKP